jgi:uncharacterized protein (DUF1499 family)
MSAPLPPAPGAHVAGCPDSPNCVSTASPASDAQHHAEPLAFTGDPSAAKARLRAIVEAMPRVRLVEETPTTLRYTFTSRIFRFVDDVDFAFVPETGTIEYRSASRVGRGDMGVNRARMDEIAAAWRKE